MNDSKLADLREKTDRQLITVIGRRLDAGLDFARHSRYGQARSAHREARNLLAVVNASPAERRRLDAKLVRLEHVLEECAAGLRVQTACL